MSPLRNNDAEDTLLDAARACLVAGGWRRTTLTDVARRAGVSRMTIYRRWPDVRTLLGDLMTREWSEVVDDAMLAGAVGLDRLAEGVPATGGAPAGHGLVRGGVHT